MQVNLTKTSDETQADYIKRIGKVLRALAKKGITVKEISFNAPTNNKDEESTVISTITPAGTFE